MKRIVFLRQAPFVGGAEVHLVDWLRGIDYSKNRVWLGCTKDLFSTRLQALGLPVQYVPVALRADGSFLGVFYSWLRFLWRLRPDRIVMGDGSLLEWPLPTVLAAYFAARGRVYMSEHTPNPKPPPKASRIHFGFLPGLGLWWYWSVLTVRARPYLTKRVIAVSQGVKEWLVHTYGYPSDKVTVVHHGVDTTRFDRPDARARAAIRASMGLPEDATVVASTARLSPEKQIDQLVKAFDTLSGTHENLWLLLAGEGPREEELRGLAQSSLARERIKFLGFLEDVSPVLRASDIFVLPSAYEGLSIAALEAMASGLVSVVTNSGGPREFIRDGVNGFLVEVSYEGVLQGLKKALDLSDQERQAMGRAARQTIISEFQLGQAIRKALEAFDITCSEDCQIR